MICFHTLLVFRYFTELSLKPLSKTRTKAFIVITSFLDVMSHAKLLLTRRGLAEMRLPFFSSSDSRGEGGGVAFWARSLFCGESSTRTASPPSLGPGPGGSAAGRNTPTP